MVSPIVISSMIGENEIGVAVSTSFRKMDFDEGDDCTKLHGTATNLKSKWERAQKAREETQRRHAQESFAAWEVSW
jgi:hypothetical protein